MKIYFENAAELFEAVKLFEAELGFTLSAEADADICVSVEKTQDDASKVSFNGKNACIIYGGGKTRFFRALAYLVGGDTSDEHPVFRHTGVMLDASRNAVMNVEHVKFMMRKMALMGADVFMLYTEDTYEVASRPYFGYMRGRYTLEELKELDSYALMLGIELVPCIQTLGHLKTYLRWHEAIPYKDTVNALLAGENETYKFIDELFATVCSCFTTKRVHIGMDETHDLGTGASLAKNGYHERSELYLAHLARVAEMAQKHGLEPMMWSDMFFRLSAKGMKNYMDYDVRTELLPEIDKLFPKNVTPVFWDYYNSDENFYAVNIKKHASFAERTVFAGGVWAWSGHAIQFSRSITNTVPALDACKKGGIDEVIATIWHNGSEASLTLGLAGVQLYAEYAYSGGHDMEKVRAGFKRTCASSLDVLLESEEIEYPHGDRRVTGASRAILYNDPLYGLIDSHIKKLDTASYYRALTPHLEKNRDANPVFAQELDIIAKLSSLLENKADFGVRLKAAYDAHDNDALSALRDECKVIIEKIEALRLAHRKSWMCINKPFGWEIHDIRYGGLKERFETSYARVDDLLNGRIEKMEELEAERLRYDGSRDCDAPFTGWALWAGYPSLITPNIL